MTEIANTEQGGSRIAGRQCAHCLRPMALDAPPGPPWTCDACRTGSEQSDSLTEFRRTHTEVDVLRQVEAAAREVDALFGGNVGRWVFAGREVTGEASDALLSLHSYLNDIAAWRS